MKFTRTACLFAALLVTVGLAESADDFLKAPGLVQPGTQTDVKPEVAGRVKKVRFALGDHVKAGDVLVEMEDAETFSTKKVRAPSTGDICGLPVVPGQFVQPVTGINSGTTLVIIGDLSKVIIETHLTEGDASKLKLMQPIQIKADAIPMETFDATITFIAPTPIVRGSVKGYVVQATIEKADTRLVPGSTVHAMIPAAKNAK